MTADSFPCPQCHEPTAADARFCASCGARLTPLEPERSESQTPAHGKQPEPRAEQPAPVGPAPVRSMWESASGRTQVIIGAAVALVGLVLVAVVLATSGSSGSTDRAAADNNDPAYDDLADLRRCQRLWNSEPNGSNRDMAQGMAEHSGTYVSVGYAADYPDKCLVTIAFSDWNQSMQFMESGDSSLGPFKYSDGPPANMLPASAKTWNAALDSANDAFITVTGR